MPFVKLDTGILDSSLWAEDPITRLTFLTMLAMSNSEGLVESTAPGIARRGNLPLDEVRKSLAKLEAPDPDDRSGQDEGRRAKRVPGGYQLVNYSSYRDKDYSAAARARKYRDRKRHNVTRDDRDASRNVTQAEAEGEAEGNHVGSRSVAVVSREALEEGRERSTALAVGAVQAEVISWSREAMDLWLQRFGGTAPRMIVAALKPLYDKHGWPLVRKAWIQYLAATEAQYASPHRFAMTFGKWAGVAPDPPAKDDVAAYNSNMIRQIRESEDAMVRENRDELRGLLKPWPGKER